MSYDIKKELAEVNNAIDKVIFAKNVFKQKMFLFDFIVKNNASIIAFANYAIEQLENRTIELSDKFNKMVLKIGMSTEELRKYYGEE